MPESDSRLARLDRLGYLLDNSIRIPVIGYRIGWDALIGLIPGVGDIAGMALSVYIIAEAARFGLPRATLARMVGNVIVEAVVGAVPLLGDLFDAAFKANLRNLALVHAQLGVATPRAPRSNRRIIVGIVLVLLAVVAVLTVLVILIVQGLVALV